MREWRAVLPDPGDGYRGQRWPLAFLALLTLVATVRSLIHMLAPDGGAHSIAGLDTNVQGGANLIALFSQWGLEQLLLALVAWVILLRYRFLVPFAILLQLLDQIGRIGLGHLKPIVVANPPPGEIASWIILPLAAIALWFSLPSASLADATRGSSVPNG